MSTLISENLTPNTFIVGVHAMHRISHPKVDPADYTGEKLSCSEYTNGYQFRSSGDFKKYMTAVHMQHAEGWNSNPQPQGLRIVYDAINKTQNLRELEVYYPAYDDYDRVKSLVAKEPDYYTYYQYDELDCNYEKTGRRHEFVVFLAKVGD
jgi:hypothetical protein